MKSRVPYSIVNFERLRKGKYCCVNKMGICASTVPPNQQEKR